MLLPHGPYTYDSAGNKIPFSDQPISSEEDKKAYVNQLAYANKILKKSQTQYSRTLKNHCHHSPGDHGYKYNNAEKNSLEFANLNAIYFIIRIIEVA